MSADKKGCREKVVQSLHALDQILDAPPSALTPSELDVIIGKRVTQLKLDVDTLYTALVPMRTRG